MNKSNPKINLFSYTSTHNLHWNVVFSHTPLQKKNMIYKIKCKLLRISLTIIKIHAFNLSHWKDKMDKRIIFGFTFHDKISRNSCNLIYLFNVRLTMCMAFLDDLHKFFSLSVMYFSNETCNLCFPQITQNVNDC